jgi:hypothetical protein
VPDARQRLGTSQALALEIDFRLVPDLKPSIGQRLIKCKALLRAGGGLYQ